ncbi:MAG: alpha/beta fold hydrolase [Candidatus Moranbacteria bacterium]|nr:alpha/beta fold hydrolase [Candidatus Moranbacteria bacterium]
MTNKIDQNKHFFLRGNNKVGILLLHGWTSPPDELFGLAEYLNSFGYSVSAPLLLGHGTRPEDLEHVTWKDWLTQSREELEKLKKHCEKIFVGGISMGGNLALLISDDESVAGVFTMGAAMRYKVHPLVKISLFFMGLTKKYRNKYYPPWTRKQMGNRKVYLRYPIESAKEVVRLSDATRKFLPRVTKPVLVMQSTTDHMVSKRSPRMIADGVKSKIKEIFWIENVYHVFVGEKKVWEKIGEFVKNSSNIQT